MLKYEAMVNCVSIILLAFCKDTAASKTSKAEGTCQVGMSEACRHIIR